MKGIVFNLLEETVQQTHGEDAWDAVLGMADLPGAYTSLGSYPDEHLGRLVAAASSALDTPSAEVVRWFGRAALPLLADRYPQFFAAHTSARSFLLTLNDIIHTEVRKIYPGAIVPEFELDNTGEQLLSLTYRSPRRLCEFAEGMIDAAAAHYDESVVIGQPRCMHRGDDACVLEVIFSP
jgi:hypothetical protein